MSWQIYMQQGWPRAGIRKSDPGLTSAAGRPRQTRLVISILIKSLTLVAYQIHVKSYCIKRLLQFCIVWHKFMSACRARANLNVSQIILKPTPNGSGVLAPQRSTISSIKKFERASTLKKCKRENRTLCSGFYCNCELLVPITLQPLDRF